MRIDTYQPDDLPHVIALWQAANLTRPWNDPATDIAFCMRSPDATLLLGRDDATGKIIGSAMTGHDGHRGWVYYVAVAPDRQGEGLGAQLMAAAEAWLTARDVPKLHLMVRDSNAQAIGFYERLGYKVEPVKVLSKWLRPPPAKPTTA
ncbi:MAG TPA: GNAT family acetyltransferase [bacterium]